MHDLKITNVIEYHLRRRSRIVKVITDEVLAVLLLGFNIELVLFVLFVISVMFECNAGQVERMAAWRSLQTGDPLAIADCLNLFSDR